MWPENQAALEVFLECHWDRQVGGFGGALWMGIRSEEIRATADMQRRPRKTWRDLLTRVRILVNFARPGLNRIEADRAPRK